MGLPFRAGPFRALALVVALATPGAALAQSAVQFTLPQMRTLAIETLQNGAAQEALALADALLLRDPADQTALFIRTEALLMLEQYDAASRAAAAAFRASPPGDARFNAARLAALAHSHVGRDTSAQIWLRRSLQHAPNAQARAGAIEDYNYLRQHNPFSVSLSFGITPSSNINGGTNATTVVLPLGTPTDLSPDTFAFSGLQIAANVGLSYRLHNDDNSATFAKFRLNGRTYVLSQDTLALDPEASGNDYSDAGVTFSLTHIWQPNNFADRGTVELATGLTWYDGDFYTRFVRASGGLDFQLNNNSLLNISAMAELLSKYDNDAYWTTSISARYIAPLGNGDRLTLGFGLRSALTDRADSGYDGFNFSANYRIAEPVAGLQISLGLNGESRDYAYTNYGTVDPQTGLAIYSVDREDQRLSVHISAAIPQAEIYGFTPTVTLEQSQTWSTIDFFGREDLRVGLTWNSSF